jgi:hypothetical protein
MAQIHPSTFQLSLRLRHSIIATGPETNKPLLHGSEVSVQFRYCLGRAWGWGFEATLAAPFAFGATCFFRSLVRRVDDPISKTSTTIDE